MKRASRHMWLVTLATGLVWMSSAQGMTVRIAAVAVNGVRFDTPMSALTVDPGDVIEVEVLVSGWSGELDSVAVWQVALDNSALIFGDALGGFCGPVKPLHFDDRFFRQAGAFISVDAAGRGVCDAASTNAGANCVNNPITCRGKCLGGSDDGIECGGGCPGGTCSEPTCVDGLCSRDSPDFGNYQWCATPTNQSDGGDCVPRPDFIMAGGPSICSVRTFSTDYVYSCTAFGGPGAVYTGEEFYAGTILLDVGNEATSAITLDVVSNPLQTFFSDQAGTEATLDIVPLEIQVGCCHCDRSGACCLRLNECGYPSRLVCADAGGVYLGDFVVCADYSCACPQVVSAVPPNCAVDARYPQVQFGPINPRLGLDSVQVTFDSVVAGVLTVDDIEVQSMPLRFGQAVVERVTNLGGGTIQVDFDRPIASQAWFCLQFCGDERNRVCWGRLPGDVNGDGASSPADILPLIDGLNGVGEPLGRWQCDVDLSGLCSAPDILGEVDVLNGAGFSRFWNGESLVGACPSVR